MNEHQANNKIHIINPTVISMGLQVQIRKKEKASVKQTGRDWLTGKGDRHAGTGYDVV